MDDKSNMIDFGDCVCRVVGLSVGNDCGGLQVCQVEGVLDTSTECWQKKRFDGVVVALVERVGISGWVYD